MTSTSFDSRPLRAKTDKKIEKYGDRAGISEKKLIFENLFDKPSAEPNAVRAMPRREMEHENERFRQAEGRAELIQAMPRRENDC